MCVSRSVCVVCVCVCVCVCVRVCGIYMYIKPVDCENLLTQKVPHLLTYIPLQDCVKRMSFGVLMILLDSATHSTTSVTHAGTARMDMMNEIATQVRVERTGL